MATDEQQLAERLVSIVVVVLVLKAAGVVLLLASASFRATSGSGVPVAGALAAGLVAAVGLHKGLRWAWPLALAVLVLDAVLIPGILRWLIDFGLALVLTWPQVRGKYGIR